MKDKSLKVLYRRHEGGGLGVWLMRGKLHLATIGVQQSNMVDVVKGKDNRSPLLVMSGGKVLFNDQDKEASV